MHLALITALVLAAPARPSALDNALGFRLPEWGSSRERIEKQFRGELEPYRPEPCPMELFHPDSLQWKQSGREIAGLSIWKIAFHQSASGLNSVSFNTGWLPNDVVMTKQAQLQRHLEQHLGKPALAGRFAVAWKLPNAWVAVIGPTIVIGDPSSNEIRRNFELFERVELLERR